MKTTSRRFEREDARGKKPSGRSNHQTPRSTTIEKDSPPASPPRASSTPSHPPPTGGTVGVIGSTCATMPASSDLTVFSVTRVHRNPCADKDASVERLCENLSGLFTRMPHSTVTQTTPPHLPRRSLTGCRVDSPILPRWDSTHLTTPANSCRTFIIVSFSRMFLQALYVLPN